MKYNLNCILKQTVGTGYTARTNTKIIYEITINCVWRYKYLLDVEQMCTKNWTKSSTYHY